jgi:drug/metabolite transporter (DMT)-like permease
MPPVIHRTMTSGEWSQLVFLAVLWGGSYFYVGVAIKVLTPLEIVAFRVTLGALSFISSCARPAQDAARLGSMGCLLRHGPRNNVIPFNLISWGQSHVASGLAAILNATTPLFAVILAHHLTRTSA